MDFTLPVRREAPWLALRVFLFACLVYAAAVPLGLANLGSAEGVTRTLYPQDAPSEQANVLSLALNRMALLVPIGDLPLRLSLLSAVCAAAALAMWIRAGFEVLAWLRPPPHARLTANDVGHEPIVVVGATLLVGVTVPFFVQATSATGAGPCLLLVASWSWATLLLLRDPSDARIALTVFFTTGLGVASAPSLAAMLLPPAVGLWLWGLQRRARWSLLGPWFFVFGTLALVGAAALEAGPTALWTGWWQALTLAELRRVLGVVTAHTWLSTALILAESLGVLGSLLILIGFGVLGWRAPAVAAVVLFTFWVSVLLAAAGPDQQFPVALWLGVASLPLGVGMLHFAAKLGQAKIAAALALAVMALVSPALSGGHARWRPESRLALRLLTRAHWDVTPRSNVDAEKPEAQTLLRYGSSLGLRPDVTVKSPANAHGSTVLSR